MSLQFKRCTSCGRIFDGFGLECPDCVMENERQFNLLKDFIWENPRASMTELSEETGVPPKLITRFIREGRLELDNAEGLIVCEKCGAPITSGTLCRNCKDKLAHAMDSVLPNGGKPLQKEEKTPIASKKSDKLHVRVNGR